jgi:hypothetical protein
MTGFEIIKALEAIASDCGDNLDREGEYTSDKIRNLISKIKEK